MQLASLLEISVDTQAVQNFCFGHFDVAHEIIGLGHVEMDVLVAWRKLQGLGIGVQRPCQVAVLAQLDPQRVERIGREIALI